MKICPNCEKVSNIVSVIEIKCNGKSIHGLELCPKCRDNFLKTIPLYKPKVQDVLPSIESDLPIGTKIVTQEQLWDILQGNLDPNDLEELSNHEPCPNCGLTSKDLSKSGRLGCPECYNHFEDLVIEFAEKFHGSTKHVGKQPKINELKLKLAYAKEHGDFVQAAALVNEIKKLESK